MITAYTTLGTTIGARSGNAKRITEADVVSGKEQTMIDFIIGILCLGIAMILISDM